MDVYNDVDFDILLEELLDEDYTTGDESTEDSSSDQLSDSLSPRYVKVRKVPKKKRLQEYAREIHIPKVLKTDIRNSYAAMFANVLNSGDLPLVFGFMDTFFVPEIEQSYTKQLTDENNQLQNLSGHHLGRFELIKYWFTTLSMGPDLIFHLRNPRVHSFSKTHCVQIVCDYQWSGTKLYQEAVNQPSCQQILYVKAEPGEEELVKAVSRAKIEEKYGTQSIEEGKRKRELEEARERDEKREIMLQIMQLVTDHFNTMVLREQPLVINAKGTFTMYTDEFRRITKVEMNTVVDNCLRSTAVMV